MTLFLLVLVDSKNVIFILPQKGAKHKEANHMDNNKKPSWKERLSNRTLTELMQLALFFQCIALALQIGAFILTVARLVL